MMIFATIIVVQILLRFAAYTIMADVLMKLSRSFNYEIYHCNIIPFGNHYSAFTIIHHPILDRFNPFLKTEYSYAKVPKGTQQYVILRLIVKEGKA